MSDDYYAQDYTFNQIKSIDFDVFGGPEVSRISALGEGLGVEIAELYGGDSEPKKGGLVDPRLGTANNEINCATCGLNTTYCVGHFGHIDLAEIFFHIGYLPFVHKILSCICIRCSKLLIYKNENEMEELIRTKSGKERMTYIRAISKNITHCQKTNYGCGAPVPSIKIDVKKSTGEIKIIAEIELDKDENEGRKKLRQDITPSEVYDILKNINDTDCRILGLDPKRSRPEDMLHKIFPVPPVQMRPSARGEFMGGVSLEDDLTGKLSYIVKANMRIIKNKENQLDASGKQRTNNVHLLQYHLATYIENDSMTMLKAEQNGKPFKSISSRLKGKTGRVRGNLMGKRGDHSGRTVITSDPTIGNNQLGVPVKIAMNLTFPEVVAPNNIEYLRKLVKNGTDVYPGANFVFPLSTSASGKRTLPIGLRYKKEATEIHYGDVVERHLVDGDIVLLNRQPTLHKQSMMGHRIKVINDPELMTYRLSVAITTPYNADFDGDEMNVFLPQSIQTQIELEEIACVEKQIITPTTSKTIVGIVQDGLLGAYNLTSPTVRIDWRSAMNIMSYTSLEDFTTLKKGNEFTGAQLYSLIIPPGINLSKATLKIKNGQLIEGRLSKDVLGAKKKNNLVQLIWDGYGVEDTKNFIDNTQKLINNFNLWHGFSVGVGDIYIPDEVHDQIEKLFQTKDLKVEHIITEMENNPDIMEPSLYEHKLFSEMNIIRDDVSKLIMANLKLTNGFSVMASSGSKGDPTNIGQMIGCLGLQALDGKIISKKYNYRTLPYYHQNDDRPESRGLVKQSFVKGLEFPEFVFHLMAGRMGLIEQAIKSVTGDTSIVIQENGTTKQVLIGEWIDDLLKNNNDSIKREKYKDQELLNITHDVYIPTCDDKGHTSWQKMTAVTRHDPTDEIYEISTYGGRKVNVASSKSLLVWNNNIFEPKLTTDVVDGDLIPVAHTMQKPRIINEYIDMTKYLYETNRHISDKIKHIDMKGIIQTVKEYLDNRNGLSDKFKLNKHNGVFVGLFIADGDANIASGIVNISNNNENIKKFVSEWFNNMKIHSNVDLIGSVSGFSVPLAKFMTKLVGSSHKKHVPHEAFDAPDEFIVGLLDGYFSGHGTIERDCITVCSKSLSLIEGISLLCNRLGIFGRITESQRSFGRDSFVIIKSHEFNIRGQWAQCFRNKVSLTNDMENEKLQNMESSEKDNMLIEQNDVVLDKITSIKKLDVTKYKKLYDVTVPSTLNFQLRNGIICYDTSETGYTQRKLVKFMEDIMIKYDGSVRNAKDRLIQLVYGDSGADTTKQYEYILKMIEMNNDEIKNKFKFTSQELKNIKGFSEKDNDKLYNDIIDMRDFIRESVRKAKMNYIILVTNFMLPVNLNRIIDTIAGTNMKGEQELGPKYILEQIELLLENKMTTLICMSQDERSDENSFKYRDDRTHKTVFRASLYDSLNPKRILIDLKLNKVQFDKIIGEIQYNFNKNIAEPGEMAGVIGSTSLGEPLTQLTLNSFHTSGIASMAATVQGMPRMKELLSVSKKPKTPQMSIYLTDEYMTNKEMAHKIASYVKNTTLGEIRKRINIYYDPDPKAKDSIMEKDNIKNVFFHHKGSKTSCQSDISGLPWLMRIELSREKMLEKEVTLLDIKSKFCSWWEKRLSDNKTMKKEEKKVLTKITQLAILSNIDNDNEPILHIRFNVKDVDREKNKFDIGTLNNFIDFVIDKFKLKGVTSVTDIPAIQEERMLIFNNETGNVDRNMQHVIYTTGVNLKEIRYLMGIDLTKTISNHVIEVYETFGIEIARSVLLREISNAYERAGGEVNYQHISLIVDQMTSMGTITSIDRHGMNKSDSDPLTRASFEKVVEQLLVASVYGETDNMKGVSARIMAGQVIKGGTGYCELKLDTDMIEKSEYIEDIDYAKKFTKLSEGTLANDIINKENEDIFMPI